jgi:hypothetical protein
MTDQPSISATSVTPISGGDCYVEILLNDGPVSADRPPQTFMRIRLAISGDLLKLPPTLAEYQIAALDQAIEILTVRRMELNEDLRPLGRQWLSK